VNPLNVFKLFGEIAIKGKEESKRDINDVTQEAASAGNKLASTVGKIALKTAKIGAVAIGTVATGVVALTKSAVENYAEYEQLVGGVETLFKNSSKTVMKYANNAYKNAGLSANQYMTTVTGFSASLLQSLEGDTERAAEVANMAIEDMADNANKMGTSMESIQNAYQGFAKQNYTMLDNLKLGYGGTKEEMERLLKDAQELKAANGEMVEYSINSYADIIDAIHTVQVEMGIYGTTSKEAATTIQGSMSMMKAAWQNFITGMADESQDFNTLLNNLIDSILTFADNLVPRILQTLPRLIKGLTQLVKKLAPQIPKLLKELIPAVIDGAKAILKAVIDDLPELLETMFGDIGGKLGSVIQKALSVLIPAISEFAQTVLPIIINAIEFLSEHFTGIVTTIGTVVAAFETFSIIKTVTTAISGASSAFGAFSAVLSANPIGMVVTAIGALALALSGLSSLLDEDVKSMDAYTRASHDELLASQESVQNYRELKSAIQEKCDADLVNIDNTEKLWAELQTLVDEQGNVKAGEEDRASFIVGQLQDALGIEIELTNGQIKNYQDLKTAVEDAINMKKAEILMQASEEAYSNAIKNLKEQENDAAEKYAKYEQARQAEKSKMHEIELAWQEAEANGLNTYSKQKIDTLNAEYDSIVGTLSDTRAAYNNSLEVLQGYYSDIETYEDAYVAASKGNTEEVISILNKEGKEFKKAAAIVGEATEQEKEEFRIQAEEAKKKYDMILTNYKNGAKGFTYEMVATAFQQYKTAQTEYAKVGGAMGDSIISGANNKSSAISSTLSGIVKSGLNAALSAASAKIASTGTKTTTTVTAKAHAKGGIVKKGEMAFLEGDGTEAVVPLEKNTEWIGKVADQFNTEMDSRQVADSSPAITISLAEKFEGLASKFDELIELLTNQRIYLDSDVLVGELTPALDTSLGQAYSRKARGI